MKSGALDFLTKASAGDQLLEAVSRALLRDGEDRAVRPRKRDLCQRYQTLTPCASAKSSPTRSVDS
jgi:FixJ family two-component response regulator